MSGGAPARVVFFRAIPDNSRLEASLSAGGTPVLHLPGHWNPELLADRKMAKQYEEVWFCPGQDLILPPDVKTLVNLCAAPDACELGLTALEKALRPDMAVLNHPRAITMTRRDAAEIVFRRLQGLRVPPAVRFVTGGADAFALAFAASGFSYPVRLTPETAHPDESWRIDGPSDWATLRRRPWGRRTWVMEQSDATEIRWRMMLGIVGRTARAEVFDADPTPTSVTPPLVAPDLVQRLSELASGCLPLDVWTLIVRLEPGGPVLDRVFAGLPDPRLPDGTGFDQAARRITLALKPMVSALMADTAGWRAAPVPSVAPPVVPQGARA